MPNATDITDDRTRLEIARLAYFDIRQAFDKDGEPIPIHKLPDGIAAALVGVTFTELFSGNGEHRKLSGIVKKYTFANKNVALEQAAKILGMFEKDNAQSRTTVVLKDYTGRRDEAPEPPPDGAV